MTTGAGILGVEAIHFYARDLARSQRFYQDVLGLPLVAQSSAELRTRGKQNSLVFDTGEVKIVVSSPEGEGGRAARFLQQHPDGVGTVVFAVEDAAHAYKWLEQRGATPIDDLAEEKDSHGTLKHFTITTPFGGSTFRFVERNGYANLFPGLDNVENAASSEHGVGGVDHITANFETMAPTVLWLEHVMGFKHHWDIQFHTSDTGAAGSGLRSIVMRDPRSGVKFACNEPLRPHFKDSQINLFHRHQRGDGIQHIALTTGNLIESVRTLRERGARFMVTPGAYYDALPARMESCGVGTLNEPIDELRELGILVDGHAPDAYLLQIFLEDSQTLYGDEQAGPFFLELIERKGDQGFGEGNFRALFESVERAQGAA